MSDEAVIIPPDVAAEVEAKAGELYMAAAAEKQAQADATAHERRRDRDGNPIPHVLAPWSAVKSPYRELWLDKAREVLGDAG